MAHICNAQIFFSSAQHAFIQCTNVFLSPQIYFSVHKLIFQWTNMFLSAQMYFSVHKYIFQCTNLFLSAQIYFSVHKSISQCTNVFISAQIYFSVHKCISQCLVTWFSRAFLLFGWGILLSSFALQIDRPSRIFQFHTGKHVLFLLWCSSANFLFILS